MDTVNRWLGRIPEPVTRLDLEGLEGGQRRAAIEQWYTQEQQALLAQTAEAQTSQQQQLDQLERQCSVLLAEDRGTAD